MKNLSTLLVLGGAVLLVGSLFKYSRSLKTVLDGGASTTTSYSLDGAGLAVVIFAIAILLIFRRPSRFVKEASIRVGLDPKIPFPRGASAVLAIIAPFLVIGSSMTTNSTQVVTTFAWGSSTNILEAYLLFALLCWLTVLFRRLREIWEVGAAKSVP
jgi:predicted Co/Zn/Cd cation transporter (cation efflux family)